MANTSNILENNSAVQFAIPDPNDFDWNDTGKAVDTYKSDDRTKQEALYDQTLNQVLEREIVMGEIIGLTSKEAVVNIGYKSDGLIPLAEFRHMPDLKVGDKIEVYVETAEDKNGQLILSHKKARAMKSWERVNEALEKDEVITGYVKCRTKGGLIVDVFGIEAFLPGSQIDVKPIRDYDIYVGKTMEFKIVKINQEFKNVVVSHKVLIENEMEKQKVEIMSKLEKGQVLEGTVKNITSYGVFMDLGGVDGLLHITDISWGRITHPEEVLKLDEKINVVILDFDDEKKRIALGLKQLTPQPWESLDKELKQADKVKGKVVVLTDYGAFVELDERDAYVRILLHRDVGIGRETEHGHVAVLVAHIDLVIDDERRSPDRGQGVVRPMSFPCFGIEAMHEAGHVGGDHQPVGYGHRTHTAVHHVFKLFTETDKLPDQR